MVGSWPGNSENREITEDRVRPPNKILQYEGHTIKQYKLADDETFYTWQKPDRSIEGILQYDNVGMRKTADKLEAIFHRLREKGMFRLPSNNEDISHLLFKTAYRKEENFEYPRPTSTDVQIKYKLDFKKPPLNKYKGYVLKRTLATTASIAIPSAIALGVAGYLDARDAAVYFRFMETIGMGFFGALLGGLGGLITAFGFHSNLREEVTETNEILEEVIKNEQKMDKLTGRLVDYSNATHHLTGRQVRKKKKLEQKQDEIFQRLTESLKLGCVSISRKEESTMGPDRQWDDMRDVEKKLIGYFNELRREINPKEAELILRARPKKKYDAVVNKVVDGFKEKEKEEYDKMLANTENRDVLNESQEKAGEEYHERLASTGKKKSKRRKYKTLLETKGLNPDQIKEQYDDAWSDFDEQIGIVKEQEDLEEQTETTKTLEEITLAKDWQKDEKFGELVDGRYELQEKIGEGALGRLYRAKDIRNDQEVVLKFEKEELGKDTIQKRKYLHLKLMRLEKHENFIPELDANLYCKPAYIVNALIEGADLKKILDSIRELNEDEEEEQFLSMENIVSLSKDIAKALAFLHENGIAHYDVKPENVIVDLEGKSNLGDCDLGSVQKEKMASVLASMASVDNGKQIGTPNYMSPQMRGIEPGPVDERADIYSLGVTLGELVSNEAIPRAGMLEKRKDVENSFKRIISKCQEPKLKKRYQTMQEVLEDLDKIPIKSKPLQLRILDARPVEKEIQKEETAQKPESLVKIVEPPVAEPLAEEPQTEKPAETLPFAAQIQEETEETDEIEESDDGIMLEGFA